MGAAVDIPVPIAAFAMTAIFICLLVTQKFTSANIVAMIVGAPDENEPELLPAHRRSPPSSGEESSLVEGRPRSPPTGSVPGALAVTVKTKSLLWTAVAGVAVYAALAFFAV